MVWFPGNRGSEIDFTDFGHFTRDSGETSALRVYDYGDLLLLLVACNYKKKRDLKFSINSRFNSRTIQLKK